jgi:hypothetical protein
MRTVLAIILLALLVRLDKPRMCLNRHYGPYDDGEEFGYGDWFCQRRAGHTGDHAGWWNVGGILQ